MKFINTLFIKYKPDYSKLLDYGFKKKSGFYLYDISFLENSFISHISVDEKGNINDKVIETEIEEEYDAINYKNYRGDFVARVKDAYAEELIKIRDACFTKTLFNQEQPNRIVELIGKTYHETPDFPFDKFDGYAVFRYPGNNKWYGLIMNVKRSNLDKNSNDEEDVEGINIKVSEEDMPLILKLDGVYPGYHMNRKSWVTITLDDTLSDEEVMYWIDKSRSLIISRKK
jgi:predicted DNA-binding protein (MmcQ/YjbR family)